MVATHNKEAEQAQQRLLCEIIPNFVLAANQRVKKMDPTTNIITDHILIFLNFNYILICLFVVCLLLFVVMIFFLILNKYIRSGVSVELNRFVAQRRH